MDSRPRRRASDDTRRPLWATQDDRTGATLHSGCFARQRGSGDESPGSARDPTFQGGVSSSGGSVRKSSKALSISSAKHCQGANSMSPSTANSRGWGVTSMLSPPTDTSSSTTVDPSLDPRQLCLAATFRTLTAGSDGTDRNDPGQPRNPLLTVASNPGGASVMGESSRQGEEPQGCGRGTPWGRRRSSSAPDAGRRWNDRCLLCRHSNGSRGVSRA